jgi:hypothetical protein
MPKGVYYRLKKPVIDRVLRRCIPVPEAGCWIFEGCLTLTGYGQVRVNGKGHLAHRVSYACLVGEIPDGAHVLHRCDTPCCVNPDHLWIGSHADNMRDCADKGRNGQRGERSHNNRLTTSSVKEIKASALSRRELADFYDVGLSTIDDIRKGRTWKHI